MIPGLGVGPSGVEYVEVLLTRLKMSQAQQNGGVWATEHTPWGCELGAGPWSGDGPLLVRVPEGLDHAIPRCNPVPDLVCPHAPKQKLTHPNKPESVGFSVSCIVLAVWISQIETLDHEPQARRSFFGGEPVGISASL